MFKSRRTLALVVGLAIVAAAFVAAPVASGAPTGPGTDYDLSTLGLKQATYNSGTDTITTTGTNAKVLVPGLPAAQGGRYFEVAMTPATGGASVLATWWESGVFHSSSSVTLPGGVLGTALIDVSDMGDTASVIRIRIDGSNVGSVIERVTLFEEEPSEGPNIVVILVDDLAESEMEIGFGREIPGWDSAFQRELIDAGTTFRNFFNTTPLCCPSRASYLTGQYAHNHSVYGNNGTQVPGDNGGILRFFLDGRDGNTLGVWMQAAGYTTALVGKYLNGYPDRQGLKAYGVTETYVPDGWDEWYGFLLQDKAQTDPIQWSYENFRVNENGTLVTYGPGAYQTDTEADLAVDFIERNAGESPFFLYLNPYAPHGPIFPKPAYDGTHNAADVEPDFHPACNEADLSDKPSYIRDNPDLFDWGDCWSPSWQRKLDMTLSIDELIDDVIDALAAEGVLDNTYVFFASDNGLLRGEHKIGGKSAPYESSIKVPLIVRGPGVEAGVEKPHLVLNADIAPTLLELAGGTPTPGSEPIDGESIVGPMAGAVAGSEWRDAVLVELLHPSSGNQPQTVPIYSAVRTREHAYFEYETGETEIYDLLADPYQLDSIHATAPSELVTELQEFADNLSTCAGNDCAGAARGEAPPEQLVVTDIRFLFKPERGIVKVDVEDSSGNLIEAVSVTGDWTIGAGPEPTVADAIAVTAANGKAKYTFATVPEPPGGTAVEFCVTELSHPDYAFAGDEVCGTSEWPGGPTGVTIHEDGITLLTKAESSNANAKVWVRNDSGFLVEGATVTGTWTSNGADLGSFSGVSIENGKAKVLIDLVDPQSGDVLEFCVTDMTHPSYTYDPGSNTENCDSITWP